MNPNTLLVSAASDLQEVSGPLAQRFKEEAGVSVVFNLAASGVLAQQVEAGAPPDVFAAANVGFVERLQRAGLVEEGTTRLYAKGRLVVLTAKPGLKMTSLDDLRRPEFTRVAVANAATAPYGAASNEAMAAAGIAEALRPKLVVAENVRQAMQYLRLGEVDAAFVSASLAGERMKEAFLVPESFHRPLLQAAVVVKGTKHPREAKRFVEFLCGASGQALLRAHGFEQPPAQQATP